VVLHPFATDVRRTWNPYNYIDVANELYREGYQIVFSGSKRDAAGLEDVISNIEVPAISTAGKTTLGGLAALLEQASLVIAPDTGPLHLARAIGTPTVGIYWAPNLINWGPLQRSIDRPVICWEMKCSLCGVIPNIPYPFEPQTECLHKTSFVEAIKKEDVLKEAITLLRHSRGQKNEQAINEFIKQPTV
jgi:ADP-heptose:LPS heptosyltransferase